jgi:hypothetical protein
MKNSKMDLTEVRDFIRSTSDYSPVYVGCDSQKTTKRGIKETVFVTVVVIHLDACRGARVFSQTDILPHFSSIKERLLKEVEFAINVAMELVDTVGKRPLQVHLDLSPEKENISNAVVAQAIGWVRALGLVPVIKPDSIASNTVADKRCKHIAS